LLDLKLVDPGLTLIHFGAYGPKKEFFYHNFFIKTILHSLVHIIKTVLYLFYSFIFSVKIRVE